MKVRKKKLICYACGALGFVFNPPQRFDGLYFAVKCLDGHVTKKAFKKRDEALKAFKRGEVARGS